MRIRNRSLGAALAGSIALAALLGGCTPTGKSRQQQQEWPQLAQDMARAREAAMVAAGTADKAETARARGREEEAARLTQQAVDQYREALAISSEMPEAWNNLGVLLTRQTDYLAAADAFTVAMGLSPSDPRPCENLGLVYARAGWIEESLQYYDMALARSEHYLPALRGALKQAHVLGQADENRMEQVKRALMLEQDPRWRAFFEREQVRISGRLENDRRANGRR